MTEPSASPPPTPVTRRRPTVVLGDSGSPVVIDYVRSRSALRIRAAGCGAEMGLGELFTRLGVRGTELVPARRYLLFAAPGPALGGVGDLVQIFTSEEDARRAFVDLRQEVYLRSGWAELCAVELHGRVSVLCSFGRDRPLRWRPGLQVPIAASRKRKGIAMSDSILIESEASTAGPRSSTRPRIRRAVAAGVIGLASIGALALTGPGDGSTTHRPTSSTAVAPLRTAEPVGGCMSCPDYSDLPGGPAGD